MLHLAISTSNPCTRGIQNSALGGFRRRPHHGRPLPKAALGGFFRTNTTASMAKSRFAPVFSHTEFTASNRARQRKRLLS